MQQLKMNILNMLRNLGKFNFQLYNKYYRSQAIYYLEKQKLEKCIEALSKINDYAKAAYDGILLARTNLVLANMYISGRIYCGESADYQAAKHYFRIFKNINEKHFNDKMTIHGYKKLSQCYQYMKDYDSAIKCCKKILTIAYVSK